MKEFTGERVIPGCVDDELWDEHIARYAFARRFAEGKRVLDVGCGTGYGTAELAGAAKFAVGVDSAADAFESARLGGAHFVQASAVALPFPAESFDLVTAFEVIEHLEDWQTLLTEARRVLRREGAFLVSTPNRRYYTESRAEIGPNPFHVHEFEYQEFRAALERHFPFTTILLQNRAEAFVFAPVDCVRLETGAGAKTGAPEDAQFFIGVCGISGPAARSGFVHLPTTANLLGERERHIRKLQQELALTKQWLAASIAERDELLAKHGELKEHVEQQNLWALGLEKEWKAGLARISQLQDEFRAEQAAAAKMAEGYERALAEGREENEKKTRWALETEARLSEALRLKCEELAEAVRLLDRAEATVTERTVWAQRLEKQIEEMERQLGMIRDSRWVRLGRTVGLGPRVESR